MDESVAELARQAISVGVSDIHDPAVVRTLRLYVEELVGEDWVAAVFAKQQAWAAQNSDPYLQITLGHKPVDGNHLVALLCAARLWETDPEGWLGGVPTAVKRMTNAAINLAITELHADRVFAEQPSKHARDSLRKRLRERDDVWAVFHECSDFAHFLRLGIDAEPRFLIRSNPVEIILHWNGHTVPVECKVKQPGTGRVISSDAFTTLAGEIARDVVRAAEPGLLIRLGITGRLAGSDIEQLRRNVAGLGYQPTLGGGSMILPLTEGRQCTILIRKLAATTTVDDAKHTAADFGLHSTFLCAVPGAGGRLRITLVIGLEIEPEERPWNSWIQSIGDVAVKWKNSTPPGIVSIHYADHLGDPESLGPQARFREAIRFWDRTFAEKLNASLSENFRFEWPAPHFPGMFVMIQEIVSMLPQLAGVMLSSEPDLRLPGPGNIAMAYTLAIPGRLPADFPVGMPMATSNGGRSDSGDQESDRANE